MQVSQHRRRPQHMLQISSKRKNQLGAEPIRLVVCLPSKFCVHCIIRCATIAGLLRKMQRHHACLKQEKVVQTPTCDQVRLLRDVLRYGCRCVDEQPNKKQFQLNNMERSDALHKQSRTMTIRLSGNPSMQVLTVTSQIIKREDKKLQAAMKSWICAATNAGNSWCNQWVASGNSTSLP